LPSAIPVIAPQQKPRGVDDKQHNKRPAVSQQPLTITAAATSVPMTLAAAAVNPAVSEPQAGGITRNMLKIGMTREAFIRDFREFFGKYLNNIISTRLLVNLIEYINQNRSQIVENFSVLEINRIRETFAGAVDMIRKSISCSQTEKADRPFPYVCYEDSPEFMTNFELSRISQLVPQEIFSRLKMQREIRDLLIESSSAGLAAEREREQDIEAKKFFMYSLQEIVRDFSLQLAYIRLPTAEKTEFDEFCSIEKNTASQRRYSSFFPRGWAPLSDCSVDAQVAASSSDSVDRRPGVEKEDKDLRESQVKKPKL
jgi:hypothetical protein